MKYKGIILIIAVIACLLVFASAYVVDETEQVVVTQFGKVMGK
ncbi:MAG: protease modulator HflC, partial [Desulfobacteraceae bacterium]|nr:protease modulator HflC [Desulfobacteraceae bacterium]